MAPSLRNPIAIGIAILALVIVASMALKVVPETRQGIVLRYGEPQFIWNAYRDGEQFGRSGAGVYAKIPLLDQVVWLDKRVPGVEMERQEVLSTDQLRLQVDAFARFRIVDPLRTYETIRSEEALGQQLRTILGSALRNELGRRSFATLLSPERGEVMQNIQRALDIEARKYGARIIDVRIKRADLPAGTPLESAYERMRTARQQEAIAIDAQGQREAQVIRANAEAEAARIYAESYGKDPDFYDFYRSMESYRQTFQNGGGSSNVVLSPDNSYLRNFRSGGQ